MAAIKKDVAIVSCCMSQMLGMYRVRNTAADRDLVAIFYSL